MTSTLSQRIQQFYDASSGLWEQVWGEHMHHGYYGATGRLRPGGCQAQVDLIEELLAWGQVKSAQHILDVGCGIGGSSLYLADKFGSAATGITLSPVQAARGTARSQGLGLSDRTSFQVADALQMPFAEASFDLVWSLESGEHMPDKAQFLQECCRVLKPGGTLLLATWCHRRCPPDLSVSEQRLLAKIYRVYHLPAVISIEDYEALAAQLPLAGVTTADWSEAVAPFWEDVIASALNPAVLWQILRAGGPTLQGALALRLMAQGYRQGLIRYGLLRGTRV
ncbi:methyltransferase domain-containing protein [Synechococcales cyanobacterium C]|uniref:Methyltransferase domain-containing protein n=1 Tax=Petrachloros mirabilis ULC683 TaxID=2781853 RepID=A0A8K1ZY45_9CYAN|nr:methyltransferase domain-containing protein [Petrachloros mirabilis]NCJ05782.1 methyltransferase domain-containing protein [Petrachloros mirabilis ULC683]